VNQQTRTHSTKETGERNTGSKRKRERGRDLKKQVSSAAKREEEAAAAARAKEEESKKNVEYTFEKKGSKFFFVRLCWVFFFLFFLCFLCLFLVCS